MENAKSWLTANSNQLILAAVWAEPPKCGSVWWTLQTGFEWRHLGLSSFMYSWRKWRHVVSLFNCHWSWWLKDKMTLSCDKSIYQGCARAHIWLTNAALCTMMSGQHFVLDNFVFFFPELSQRSHWNEWRLYLCCKSSLNSFCVCFVMFWHFIFPLQLSVIFGNCIFRESKLTAGAVLHEWAAYELSRTTFQVIHAIKSINL